MIATKSFKIAKCVSAMLLSSIILSGCVTPGSLKESNEALYVEGGYKAVALKYLDENDSLVLTTKNDLNDLLIGAKALHDAGYWLQSSQAFDLAHEKLRWKSDTIDTPEEVGKFLVTSVTNDTFASYNGKIFEGVMLDYYQSINFLMLGDQASTRVHFNRLEERQRNAETQLTKFTESISKQESEKTEEELNQQAMIAKSQSEVSDQFNVGLSNLPNQVRATEIRTPVGDLLGAIFLGTSHLQAMDKNRIDGMISAASSKGISSESRKFAMELGTELKRNSDHVFILYEDGFGPTIDEFRVDLPVFLLSDQVLYTGIALPKFQPGAPAHSSLSIHLGNSNTNLAVVTDTNRIASLEFESTYRGKVAKAISSAVLKTVAQLAINKEIDENTANAPLVGLFAKVLVAGGQAALTRADTRSWSNLPNTISMGVIERNGSNQISFLDASGNTVLTEQLPSKGDVLVYAKRSASNGELKIHVQRLPASNAVSVASN